MSLLGSIFDRERDEKEVISAPSAASESNRISKELESLLEGKEQNTPTMLQNGVFFFLETLFYFISLVCLLGVIFFLRITPFDIFAEMLSKSEVKNALGGVARIQDISFVVRILVGTLSVFSLIIARNFHKMRKQRSALTHILKSIGVLQKKLQKMS